MGGTRDEGDETSEEGRMNGRRKVHVMKRMKVEGGEGENTERNFLEKWGSLD